MEDRREDQNNREEGTEDHKDLLVALVGGVDEEDEHEKADASDEFEHPHRSGAESRVANP